MPNRPRVVLIVLVSLMLAPLALLAAVGRRVHRSHADSEVEAAVPGRDRVHRGTIAIRCSSRRLRAIQKAPGAKPLAGRSGPSISCPPNLAITGTSTC